MLCTEDFYYAPLCRVFANRVTIVMLAWICGRALGSATDHMEGIRPLMQGCHLPMFLGE